MAQQSQICVVNTIFILRNSPLKLKFLCKSALQINAAEKRGKLTEFVQLEITRVTLKKEHLN